jgi:hypothetical protein
VGAGLRLRGLAPAAGLAVLLACSLAACGDDEPAGGGGADAAAAVCTMLRGWNDDLSEVMNDTSQTITDEDDPTTANDVLVGGFDEMIAVAEDHVEAVDELDLPAVEGRDALRDELRSGAEEAVTVLEEERTSAAALEPIDVEGQRGALGGAFTGLERATSVFEPRIARYDDELQQAFRDDTGCRHVVQPTGGD